MTCTLKIFKRNKLVNIKNIGELNALKQLSIILLRDKICGIKAMYHIIMMKMAI